MRAPAESLMPMIEAAHHGHPLHRAWPPCGQNISPTEPWNTIWSWLNTPTGRAVDGAVAGDRTVIVARVGGGRE